MFSENVTNMMGVRNSL